MGGSRNLQDFYPHSSKVEHPADNRKTKDRYLLWVPSFAYSVMVAPGSPRHESGVGSQMPGRGSIPQRKFSFMSSWKRACEKTDTLNKCA